MIRLSQIKQGIDEDDSVLKERICRKLQIDQSLLIDYQIVRKSIDARKDFVFSYIVDCRVKEENALQRRNKHTRDMQFISESCYRFLKKDKRYTKSVAIVGSGPAGLFCAYTLIQLGFKVDLFERGGSVDERNKQVNGFWNGGELNENSNILFGEGGAGTFSDGKLTARNRDEKNRFILETFVKFGADKAILYDAYPHIGSDVLTKVVKNMRCAIIEAGAHIHFNSLVKDLKFENNIIKAINVQDQWITFDLVVLAIGHSATDTFQMLKYHNFAFEAKDFALGVRIEHPQSLINAAQYKNYATHPKCPKAVYQLSAKASDNRGVYTFCMCPGGQVIHAAHRRGTISVNGMSNFKRDMINANSALLVQVHASDFNHDCWEGLKLQEDIERKAYAVSNSYQAPTQLVKDFLRGKVSENFGDVKPSYPLGSFFCDLNTILPEYVSQGLKEGLLLLDHKLNGFAKEDAILTGVETRSSSPIRILRDPDSLQAQQHAGIYLCGEGAGYSGGIISSAVDGLKVMEKIRDSED